MHTEKNYSLQEDILKYFSILNDASDQITDPKRSKLRDLALYINSKLKSKSWVNIVFLSPSDNSLGQFGQIWVKVMTTYNKLGGLEAYSAGKNRKKIHPVALNTISNHGFKVRKVRNGDQPVYVVKYAENMPAIKLFSKPLKHRDNPGDGYVALIINQNEKEIPVIPGAEFRMPLNYEIRPGENDEEKYERICRQIGADMFFIFSNLDQAS